LKSETNNPVIKTTSTTTQTTKDFNILKEGIEEANSIRDLEDVISVIKESNHPRKDFLIKEAQEKIDAIKWMEALESVSESIEKTYWKDIYNAFKKLYTQENNLKTTKWADKYSTIEFNKTPWFKSFSEKVREYIDSSPWEEWKTVQDIYDELKNKILAKTS